MSGKTDQDLIKDTLKNCCTIAVVGLSAKQHRDSFKVAQYMQKCGFRIIPVNPSLREDVLGEKPYSSLQDIPHQVDIVNIFKRSEDVPVIVEKALSLKPKAIWLQLGITSEAASEMAKDQGIPMIMNRCIKIEHMLLQGED